MSSHPQRFLDEFKGKVARRVTDLGHSAAEVARELALGDVFLVGRVRAKPFPGNWIAVGGK